MSPNIKAMPEGALSTTIESTLAEWLQSAVSSLVAASSESEQSLPVCQLELPKQSAHGDWACNIAMQLAKKLAKPPRAVAESIVAILPSNILVDKVEIAGPGFINIYLSQQAKTQVLVDLFADVENFGRLPIDEKSPHTVLEFVSANPTGPLHVGHGRQAALGDALANVLQERGRQVAREFYYNDAGVQIQNLAISVQCRANGLQPGDVDWPASAYNGEYIDDIAKAYLAKKMVKAADVEVHAKGDVDDIEAIRHFAVAYLRHEQDLDLQAFSVKFDCYYLESSLYTEGRVAATVEQLQQKGKTYEHEGALWLRTTDDGDDKDRVMRKSDGTYTYFVPDVAYHVAKWQRGYQQAINIQGSDHHGTVARVRAGLQGLDVAIPVGYPDYVLHKMVTVMRGGAEVKISKRAGSYVTLRDLIEWAGKDAVRFFLVSRKADTEFVFDVDLARSQSEENPVYYVQYAHARIRSILRQAATQADVMATTLSHANFDLLVLPQEHQLLKALSQYPQILAVAATELAPHHLAFYVRDLAGQFHSFYNAAKVLVEDTHLRDARLALTMATGIMIKKALGLLGVSAPEQM
jgi:arginyl-tRNA synthetase